MKDGQDGEDHGYSSCAFLLCIIIFQLLIQEEILQGFISW